MRKFLRNKFFIAPSSIQYRVLRRGCELLEIGGRLVYSTCSFNPIENEAVIHRILQETGDTVKLADVTAQLPGLKFKKGNFSQENNNKYYFDY